MNEAINPEYIPYFWYILGIILLSVEFALLPGVGVFFSGLGAVTTGIAIQAGFADDTLSQLVVFFGSTVLYGILLWKPMKSITKNKEGYKDIVGEQAEVIQEVSKLKSGLVRWSGTNMKAKIAKTSSKSKYEKGSIVEIESVRGNTLYIK